MNEVNSDTTEKQHIIDTNCSCEYCKPKLSREIWKETPPEVRELIIKLSSSQEAEASDALGTLWSMVSISPCLTCLEGASHETIDSYYERSRFASTIPVEIRRLIHTFGSNLDKRRGLLQTHIALLVSWEAEKDISRSEQ